MAEPTGGKLIFGRFTREECGLPPENAGPAERKAGLFRTVGLLAALVAAGWLAGSLNARLRERWVASLPARVYQAEAEQGAELLALGRLYAAALPDRPDLARNLAIALLPAAERSPRRLGYYGNLAVIFKGLADEAVNGESGDFAAALAASGVYAELGDYPDAFASLARADAILGQMPDELARRQRRLLLVNAQAYYLAVAPRDKGGDPEQAMRLAELMITSRDELAGGGHASGTGAFMDTLASAAFAVGDVPRARKVQTLALGLARSDELDVYLRHYDRFAK